MLALEIQINDGKPLVVGAENLTFAFFTRDEKRDEHSVLVEGADDVFRYRWMDEDMQNGDKVFIRVVEVDKDKVSSPFEMERNDRERMKLYFEKLEKELQDKQLL